MAFIDSTADGNRLEALRRRFQHDGSPVTRTLRDIPTCIRVGPDEGIDHDSVATFDNLAAVPKSVLTTRLGRLGFGGQRQICDALEALANC
jgi:mRNA-degrading endonuclease toxin of MazEF toxin-antitoxin module